MIARFLNGALFAPLVAWLVMVTVGAVQSFWHFLPDLGYKQALVICLVSAFVYSIYDSDEDPSALTLSINVIGAYFIMLLLGVVHSHWAWVPALGYFQTLLIGLPAIVAIILVQMGLALLFGTSRRN